MAAMMQTQHRKRNDTSKLNDIFKQLQNHGAIGANVVGLIEKGESL